VDVRNEPAEAIRITVDHWQQINQLGAAELGRFGPPGRLSLRIALLRQHLPQIGDIGGSFVRREVGTRNGFGFRKAARSQTTNARFWRTRGSTLWPAAARLSVGLGTSSPPPWHPPPPGGRPLLAPVMEAGSPPRPTGPAGRSPRQVPGSGRCAPVTAAVAGAGVARLLGGGVSRANSSEAGAKETSETYCTRPFRSCQGDGVGCGSAATHLREDVEMWVFTVWAPMPSSLGNLLVGLAEGQELQDVVLKLDSASAPRPFGSLMPAKPSRRWRVMEGCSAALPSATVMMPLMSSSATQSSAGSHWPRPVPPGGRRPPRRGP